MSEIPNDFREEWRVPVPAAGSWIKKLFAFVGPGLLVSVGYMDPGNWATDLAAGSRYGYTLLWVVLLSNLIAQFLQLACVRLGVGGNVDLATACRRYYPPALCKILWFLCEIAIIACDIAEVIGSAVALQLLFGLPLVVGVVITGLDVLLLLGLNRLGFRWIEAAVGTLVGTVSFCFLMEMVLARPSLPAILQGSVTPVLPDGAALAISLGILGATVMPHNLYLHSAMVRGRAGTLPARETIKFASVETVVTLSIAFLVNAAILILAASQFHLLGHPVTEIEDAHRLLRPLLGGAASTAFAIALLASGQSSTVTGTLAGQIVMEGFLRIKVKPWLRRLVSRLVAIVPALISVIMTQGRSTVALLIISQVVLSMQLPFAIGPLIQFTADKRIMGSFVHSRWVTFVGVVCLVGITFLNVLLLKDQIGLVWASVSALGVVLCGAWAMTSRRKDQEGIQSGASSA